MPHAPVFEEPSRRDLLRYGALALGTTAAAALAARPATAADGDPVVLGSTNNTSRFDTYVRCSGVSSVAFLGWANATTGLV